MKTIVIKRNAYGQGQHRLQPGFLDFAKHYRFVPSLCRPHHPQTKGKIERFIHYLRHSFYIPWVSQFKGEESFTLSDINNAVSLWLNTIANQRIHAELKAKPCILWQEELNALQPLPTPYPFALPQNINIAQETSYRTELLMQDTYSLQHDLAVYDDLCQGGNLWHS